MDLKEFKTINSDVKNFYNKVFVDEIFPYFVQKIEKVIDNTNEINLKYWITSLNSDTNEGVNMKNIIDFLKRKIDNIIPDEQKLPITWLEVILNSLPKESYPDLKSTELTNVSDDIVTKVVDSMKYVLPTNMQSYDFENLPSI
jgi:hypothetical protein